MDFALPVFIAVAAWWLSTIAIMYRAGMPRHSFATTFGVTTGVMAAGLYVVLATRSDVTTAGAYAAFLGGLTIWGWHEVSYLFGYISGPRPEACPPGCSSWQRFVLGVKTCIYHELAVVLTAAGLVALTWTAANKVALWTFLILWLMRWSAKLNIFLGVRNLHEEFWPEHLSYLKTFVGRRPMNELFPVSILVATAGLGILIFIAATAGDDLTRRTGAMLLATLLALALLEHWLLVLQVRDEALWKLGMRSRQNGGAAAN